MAWNLLAQFLFYLASYTVSALLTKPPPAQKPGEPQFPTADPERPIPVVYGKVRIGMNVVHKANLRLGENTVRGSVPFGWKPQHIGYYYYADLLATLCWGTVEALWDIIVDGDISLANADPQRVPSIGITGVTYAAGPAMSFPLSPLVLGNTPVTINAGNILGGKFGRGGVGAGSDAGSGSGSIIIHSGDGRVTHNTRLETLEGGPLPTYPGICTAAFGPDFYFGNTEQLPSIEFIISRAVAPFGGTGYIGNFTANSGNDALPGGILYDLLTNPIYGLGLPAADIDGASFNTVNNACDPYFGGAVECGLSFAITEQRTAKDVIEDLLRTLDAALYLHPTTGLLTIALLRAPDDGHFGIGGAPTITQAQITKGSFEWTESASDAFVNEVKVEFDDKARRFTKNVAAARNVAAIHALGRTESRTVRFLGVTNAALAQRLAERELRALSTSLGHASFEMDRTGVTFTPGQFFYLDYQPRGFVQKVMRVVSVRDTLAGTIAVEAVEDVYSAATSSFASLSPTEPAPPAAQPFIAPYVEEVATETATVGTLTLFVFDPSGVVTSVEFQTKSGSGTPSGFAADTFPYLATVALDPYATSAIDYRVNYTDQNGDPQMLEGSVTFGVDSDAASAIGGGVTEIAGAVNQIGSKTVFVSIEEDDTGTHGLALTTIPTAETDVGAEYRRQHYVQGAGQVRVVANVKSLTGTPTITIKYTLNNFSSVADLVSLAPSGTGLQVGAWVDMPPGAKSDIGLAFYVADGAGTAAVTLYSLEVECKPALVTAFRDFSDDFSDDFS